MRTGRSENIFFHCIFAYSHLRFLIESQLSSPTCYLGKFFQLTIVRSDTLRRYIALIRSKCTIDIFALVVIKESEIL